MTRNINALLIVTICILFLLCDKKPTGPVRTIISGQILSKQDSLAVPNANITVYNGNTNSVITRASSGVDGTFAFNVDPGIYYLKVSAQSYISSPPPLGAPVYFQVFSGDTAWRSIFLSADLSALHLGSITGIITSLGQPVSEIMIVARRESDSLTFDGTSGPDGYFVLYNMQPGTYSLQAFRAGYEQDTPVTLITVKADSASQSAINLKQTANARLDGHITFLASPNSTVDITLVHSLTMEAIPGLFTFNTGGTYLIDYIPAGDYIVWACYRNDGYVMDPDWIFKNGLPFISFSNIDTFKTQDLSVTSAIKISSPSNEPDSIYPVLISAKTPTFIWESYSQAKEYIIEVFNSDGMRIWGGFDSTTILHPQIDFHATSAVFNFDGSALDSLHTGVVYRWKIYADNSTNPGIQTLLSSSEDLLGLFMLK